MAWPIAEDDKTAARGLARRRNRWGLVYLAAMTSLLVSWMCFLGLEGFLFGPWVFILIAFSVLAAGYSTAAMFRYGRRAAQLLGVDSHHVSATLEDRDGLRLGSRGGWLALLLIGYVCWVVAAAFNLPPLIAANLITRPAHTTASRAYGSPRCVWCFGANAGVLFEAPSGLRATHLTGVRQDSTYYQPGIAIVYDAKDPSHAMALRDYQQGKGTTPFSAVGLPGIGLVAATAALYGYARRRARFYATGRPSVRITKVKYKVTYVGRDRSAIGSWRITFADHRHATYRDWPASREAVLRRLQPELPHLTLGSTEAAQLGFDQQPRTAVPD